MPSPFPGMDPYLEEPGRSPDVHHRIISVASDLLTEQVQPRYYVRIEERVYVSDESDPGQSVIVPDLRVSEARPHRGAAAPPVQGAVAVAEPIVAVTVYEEEVREAHLEIINREGGRVVTVIEVLSPANKISGANGRESYVRKRQGVLNSTSHLVEIDLLRSGLSFLPKGALPAFEYSAHVSRATQRPRGMIWPIRLPQPLPTITVPLKEGDGDASLDLQAVVSAAYQRARYDLQIDYSGDPVSPPRSRTGHVGPRADRPRRRLVA